jgi:HK97 gp10 family phage protein
MTFKVSAKLEGIKELTDRLKKLKANVAKKITKRAVTAAAKIVNKSAKRNVRKRTKLLSKSIGQKVKIYRNSGLVAAVIGPRRGFRKIIDGKPHNPVKYAHLVELGRKAVKVRKAKILTDGRSFYGVKARAVAPAPFLKTALNSNRSAITEAMAQTIREGLADAT